MQQLYSEELSILLLSLTSGYLKEGGRYLYVVILCSHMRDHQGMHPHLTAGSHQNFPCFCTGETADTRTCWYVCYERRKPQANYEGPFSNIWTKTPCSIVQWRKSPVTNEMESFLMQCSSEVKIKTRTRVSWNFKICKGDSMYDSISNQFESNLILEELRLKVLPKNLTKNQAITWFYTSTFRKIPLLISLLNMSLLILHTSFLFGQVPPFHLYIINTKSLLLALGHCDGHKEIHNSSVPDHSGLLGPKKWFHPRFLFL